jgi:hypothetical protein
MDKGRQSRQLKHEEEREANLSLIPNGGSIVPELTTASTADISVRPPDLEHTSVASASSVGCRENEDQEWSPEKEAVAAQGQEAAAPGHEIMIAVDYEEGDEEEDEREDEDELYSEGVDSGAEYTDYENEEMVQYQAAVDVSTASLPASS